MSLILCKLDVLNFSNLCFEKASLLAPLRWGIPVVLLCILVPHDMDASKGTPPLLVIILLAKKQTQLQYLKSFYVPVILMIFNISTQAYTSINLSIRNRSEWKRKVNELVSTLIYLVWKMYVKYLMMKQEEATISRYSFLRLSNVIQWIGKTFRSFSFWCHKCWMSDGWTMTPSPLGQHIVQNFTQLVVIISLT